MELDDLKSGWQAAGSAFTSEADLQRMTRVAHHPSLKKIRTKLVVETIGLSFFLLVYYDWFDGNKKSFGINALLVGSLLLYILNDVIGYISIATPIRGGNLKLSVQHYLLSVKRLFVFSLIISIVYSVSIILFFTSVINFTREKRLLLAGVIIVLFQIMLLSFRFWTKRIKNLQQQVNDFNLDEGQ